MKTRLYVCFGIISTLAISALTIISTDFWKEYSIPLLLSFISTLACLGLISREDKNSLKSKAIQIIFKLIVVLFLVIWASIHKNAWGTAFVFWVLLSGVIEFFIFKTKEKVAGEKIDSIYLLTSIIAVTIIIFTYAFSEIIEIKRWAFILVLVLTSILFNLSSYKRIKTIIW